MRRVPLNCDLGELPDEPEELYALADVVNIACGGHAGDAASMKRAVALAVANGCTVAAHPSYPDRAGFGRTSMAIGPEALALSIAEQCEALSAIARGRGVTVVTVKPHGALYHDASRVPDVARALIAGAARGLGAGPMTFVGPGALAEQALAERHRSWQEGFADRTYLPDGRLRPRSEPGALITDPVLGAEQARRLLASRQFDTLCVHGDTAGAVAIARAIRQILDEDA